MTDTPVREPIALGDSLGQLLSEHLSVGRPVPEGLVGKLRDALRCRWRIMNQIIVAQDQFSRFDDRVNELLNSFNDAGDRVKVIIIELNQAGFNGQALRCAVDQEHELVNVEELLLEARSQAVAMVD